MPLLPRPCEAIADLTSIYSLQNSYICICVVDNMVYMGTVNISNHTYHVLIHMQCTS